MGKWVDAKVSALGAERICELGLGDEEKKAPRVGRSDAGRPGTRKTRYGKTRYKRMGGKP